MQALVLGIIVFAVFCAQAQNGDPNLQANRKAWVARSLPTLRFGALFILVCACAIFVSARKEVVLAPAAPTTAVASVDFAPSDLTGPLGEVLMDGYFQLDHMTSVTGTSGAFNIETVLIPVTDAAWQVGDPVRIYVTPNWFGAGTTGTDLALGREKEGFPATSAGPVRQTRLLAKAQLFGFQGDVAQTIAAAGLPINGPVQILRIIENDRKGKIDRAFSGSFRIAKLLAGIGLALLIAGHLIQRFWIKATL